MRAGTERHSAYILSTITIFLALDLLLAWRVSQLPIPGREWAGVLVLSLFVPLLILATLTARHRYRGRSLAIAAVAFILAPLTAIALDQRLALYSSDRIQDAVVIEAWQHLVVDGGGDTASPAYAVLRDYYSHGSVLATQALVAYHAYTRDPETADELLAAVANGRTHAPKWARCATAAKYARVYRNDLIAGRHIEDAQRFQSANCGASTRIQIKATRLIRALFGTARAFQVAGDYAEAVAQRRPAGDDQT